jgi:hypothetical protein
LSRPVALCQSSHCNVGFTHAACYPIIGILDVTQETGNRSLMSFPVPNPSRSHLTFQLTFFFLPYHIMPSILPHPISTTVAKLFNPSSSTPELVSSAHSTSTSDEDTGDSTDDDIWDLVDSMYARRMTTNDESGKPISSSLIVELDGATFGVDPSTNRVPLHFPRPPTEDQDIPHFPPLTGALFSPSGELKKGYRLDGKDMGAKGQGVFRTSGELWLYLI